jgi:hypothetical protein
VINNIFPYKQRQINPKKEVEVYRCLNRRGKIYSIRQRGVVVAHTNNILLEHCEFIINEAGKKKAILTNQRNVHAYIRGRISDKNFETHKEIKYHPFDDAGFLSEGKPIKKTQGISISELGVYSTKH